MLPCTFRLSKTIVATVVRQNTSRSLVRGDLHLRRVAVYKTGGHEKEDIMGRKTAKQHQYGRPLRFGRRRLLAGAGPAAVVSAVGAVGLASPESASELQSARPTLLPLPVPSPLPGGIDASPPVGFIHGFVPGPEGSSTPFAGLPGMGLDVEPSTFTNFKGFTAFAVLSGQATGSDGKIYNVEFDVRAMEGEYVAEDGSHRRGTFGFF
jgi:hypothetical protein